MNGFRWTSHLPNIGWLLSVEQLKNSVLLNLFILNFILNQTPKSKAPWFTSISTNIMTKEKWPLRDLTRFSRKIITIRFSKGFSAGPLRDLTTFLRNIWNISNFYLSKFLCLLHQHQRAEKFLQSLADKKLKKMSSCRNKGGLIYQGNRD